MGRPTRFAPEVRERAVRMVLEHRGEHASPWAAMGSIAAKIGCSAETLRKWVRQAERDQGGRPGVTTAERDRVADARARDARAAARQRDPPQGVRVFRTGGARPPTEVMVTFIDDHRAVYGVEPICAVLPIAPSTYYEAKAREVDRTRLPERAKRDAGLREQIEQVWQANFCVYGVRKVWRELIRQQITVARCTVARLMRELGLKGVVGARRSGRRCPTRRRRGRRTSCSGSSSPRARTRSGWPI